MKMKPMKTSNKTKLFSLNKLAVLVFTLVPLSLAGTFSDGFEGSVVDPFWTLEGGGTDALTTAHAHSGTQSLTTSTLRWATTNSFGPSYGTASVWVYASDTTSTFQLQLFNSGGTTLFAIMMNYGGFDFFDGNFYTYAPSTGWSGSTGYGLSNPGPGWFQLSIDANPVATIMKINGNTVQTYEAAPFYAVQMGTHLGTGYFDDFSITTEDVPEPSACALFCGGLLCLLAWRRTRNLAEGRRGR